MSVARPEPIQLFYPKVEKIGTCTELCIDPGVAHVNTIASTCVYLWAFVSTTIVLSAARTWLTGERTFFVFVTVTSDTVGRLAAVERWYSANKYWSLLAITLGIVQCIAYVNRSESRLIPENHVILELIGGILCLFEFLIQSMVSMSKTMGGAIWQCVTRVPVDVVCIISSFTLGKISYEPPHAEFLESLTTTKQIRVRTLTWYVPTYFYAFRVLYVWDRWYSTLTLGGGVFHRLIRNLNVAFTCVPILFVTAMAISQLEIVGFDDRDYLGGPPLAEDKYSVNLLHTYIGPLHDDGRSKYGTSISYNGLYTDDNIPVYLSVDGSVIFNKPVEAFYFFPPATTPDPMENTTEAPSTSTMDPALAALFTPDTTTTLPPTYVDYYPSYLAAAGENEYLARYVLNKHFTDETAEIAGAAVFNNPPFLERDAEYKKMRNLLWTPISTFYFLIMSLTTVGAGDLYPTTWLSKLITSIAILFGLKYMVEAILEIKELYQVLLEGKEAYTQKRGVNHIIVTGTPSFQQVQDFIQEMYHEDHMVESAAGAAFETPPPSGANTETIMLLEDKTVCDSLREWLQKRANLLYKSKVFLYNGSVFHDALMPIRAFDALMIFVLPNLYTTDAEKDDATNIMRIFHLKNTLKLDVRVSVLLHLSDNRALLRSAGMSDADVMCLDEFKGAVLSKSCFLPGFSTFLCNMFKTIGGTYAGRMETLQKEAFYPWEKMYFTGLEKEIYEIDLSKAYYGLSFGEILLDILHRSDGEVLLIGVVEYGVASDVPVLKLNPGAGTRIAPWVFNPSYKDSPALSSRKIKGVFIAPDAGAIAQKFYLPGIDDQGLKARNEALQLNEAKKDWNFDGAQENTALRRFEERQRKEREAKQRAAAKRHHRPKTQNELLRANKVGELAQLHGERNIERRLDRHYPDTTRDEVPAVADPIWPRGTEKELRNRDDFPAKLAEIHAITDVKKLLGDGDKALNLEQNVLDAAEHVAKLREFLELKRRPDIKAREAHMARAEPAPPDLPLLSQGGHVLLCCLTPGDVGSDNVRVWPVIKTLRLHSEKPLLILSRSVPSDWWRVVEARQVWYLKGSPMELFDLKRANFTMARSIIIIQGGCAGVQPSSKSKKKDEDGAMALLSALAPPEPGGRNLHMVDADGIFCCKLIESNLPPLANVHVILELLVEDNYYLVPLQSKMKLTSEELEIRSMTPDEAANHHRASLFRQPRYASGKLFCSSMVTSLMVNILFNSSLVALVNGLIGCKGVTVTVLRNWVGMPLLNLLESLVWHHNLVPIAIARYIEHEKADRKKSFNPMEIIPPSKETAISALTRDTKPRFIITAPHATEEILHADDKLICLARYDPTDSKEVG